MVSNMSTVILVMATLGCAIITSAAGVMLPLSVFAQQQEETSLGEREDLGSGIVSDVLDRSSDDEEDGNDEENDGSAAGDDTNEKITVPITDQCEQRQTQPPT